MGNKISNDSSMMVLFVDGPYNGKAEKVGISLEGDLPETINAIEYSKDNTGRIEITYNLKEVANSKQSHYFYLCEKKSEDKNSLVLMRMVEEKKSDIQRLESKLFNCEQHYEILKERYNDAFTFFAEKQDSCIERVFDDFTKWLTSEV